jgi:hypothetical protein
MAKKEAPKNNSTAQSVSTIDFMKIAEIRDGVLVLPSGEIRMVLSVSSANFALKSIKEQDILIGTYQGVLNSLDGQIQILVQSRKLDLTNYIEKLKRLEDTQDNDLLKVKMQEYIIYIQQMIQQINIMSKQFYVIVGYAADSIKNDVLGGVFKQFNSVKYIREEEETFRLHKSALASRAETVASQLRTLELKVNLLKTDQLIALMYNCYNPDTLESIRINDIDALDLDDYNHADQIAQQRPNL